MKKSLHSIALIVSGAVVANLLVGGLSAASADENTVTTQTVTTVDAVTKRVEFRGGIRPNLSASVETPDGEGVDSGTVILEAKPAGGHWRSIRSAAASSFVMFPDVMPKKNTSYRVVYQGGANASTDESYQESRSGVLQIQVTRKVTAKLNQRTFVLRGRITPKFGKKNMVIKVSNSPDKGFKKFRTVKTTKKGRYRTKLVQRPGLWFYRFIVRKDKNYARTVLLGSHRGRHVR